MKDYVHFGQNKINFSVRFSERKTLGITVLPNLEITVKAPLNASIIKIKEKIKNKASWIVKQQNFFLSFHPKTPIRKYISGETHLYLGRQYRLKITLGNLETVKLKGGFIEVIAKDKSRIKDLLNDWYIQNAQIKLISIANPLIKNFEKHKVKPSSVVLRSMPTRWGSCTTKGKIILNPELIKAPRGCIEYVIIHELCHLVHHDHTSKFIELQNKEMKDWSKWKMKLEKLLA